MKLVTTFVLVTARSTFAKRVQEPGTVEQPGKAVIPLGNAVVPTLEDLQLQSFKELEAQDRKDGRGTASLRKVPVYHLQKYSFPRLSNQNAAFDVGLLIFMSNYAPKGMLKTDDEFIVKSEVVVKVADNEARAERHYIKYNDDKPDKDPTKYGIDTVGLLLRQKGGWLSFPDELECKPWETPEKSDCAWQNIKKVKTIHTACLLNVLDDGIGGTHVAFGNVVGKVRLPRDGTSEKDLRESGVIALRLFHKGFDECPNVWDGETVHTKIGLQPAYTKGKSERRCCCWNSKSPKKFPGWVRFGVCLPDVGRYTTFVGMWSMSRVPPLQQGGCAGGKAKYLVDPKRGRCLTRFEALNHETTAILSPNDATSLGYTGELPQPFRQAFPKLRKSAWKVLGAQLVMKNDIFKCDSDIGMHHLRGCDCTWAGDEC